jgi:hypothetical protein
MSSNPSATTKTKGRREKATVNTGVYWVSVGFCVSPFVGLGFALRASHLQTGALPLEPHLQPIHFALVIVEVGSHKLFTRLALNRDPPGLSLPSTGVGHQPGDFFVLFFKTGSSCIAQTDLELAILLPHPPKWLGLQPRLV